MSRQRFSRRDFLRLSAVGAGAMLLPANRLTSSSESARTRLQSDPVTLNVFVHGNHPWDNVKPLFEKKYPNVKLNMMGVNDDQVFRAALAAASSAPGDVPDLFWPEPFTVQELGKTGALFDTTALIEKYKADFPAGKLAECYIPSIGKYASVPGGISVTGLYYRQDLWEKAKVTIPDDWTWDEFIEAAIKVKKDTGAYSLFQPTDGSDFTSTLWTFILAQLGGAVTNVDGTKVTLDDDKGIAAMKLVKKMYDAGIAIEDGMFSETFFAAVKGGKVAALPMQDWYRPFGIEPNVKTPEEGLGKWRVALLPRAMKDGIRTANFGGANTASTKFTTHPKEVADFMEFAHMTNEGSSAIAQWGLIPAYLPYLQGAEWQALRSPIFGDFAFNKVWAEAVKQYPPTWYKLPIFGEATAEVGAQMPNILKGKVELEAAMKTIGDTVRKLNARYQG